MKKTTFIFFLFFLSINQVNAHPLIDAADNSNIKKLQEMLTQGVDINVTNNAGYTALHRASYHGYLKIVKYLLDAGANVNAKTMDGYTPLDSAVSNNHLQIVKLLISKGASFESIRRNKQQPIDIAERKGYAEIVKELLKMKGMYLEDRRQNGTPLFWASENNHLDIVLFLLNSGVSVNKTSFGITPLEISARKGNNKIVNVLKKKADESLFLNAAEGGLLSLVQELLLSKKVDINTTNGYNSTALHKAAYSNHIDVVKYLISKGININLKDKGGATALFWATSQGNTEVAEYLRKNGAEITDPNKMLFAAASGGYTSLVMELLSKGVDVNTIDPQTSKTPLFGAVIGKHFNTVKLLLSNGAKTNVKYLGKSPLQWAKDKRIKEILKKYKD